MQSGLVNTVTRYSKKMSSLAVLVPPECVICGAHATNCIVDDNTVAFCTGEHASLFLSTFDPADTLRQHVEKSKKLRIQRGRPSLPGGFNPTDLAVLLHSMYWSGATPEWQNNQTRLQLYLGELGCGSTQFVSWCTSILDASVASALEENAYHYGLEINSQTDHVDTRFLAKQLAMIHDCWRTGDEGRAKTAILQTHKMLMFSVLYHQQMFSEPEVCLDSLEKKTRDIFHSVLVSCVPSSALPRATPPTLDFHKATNIPMYQKVQQFVVTRQ